MQRAHVKEQLCIEDPELPDRIKIALHKSTIARSIYSSFDLGKIDLKKQFLLKIKTGQNIYYTGEANEES